MSPKIKDVAMETDDALRKRLLTLVDTLDDRQYVLEGTGNELDRMAQIAGITRHATKADYPKEKTIKSKFLVTVRCDLNVIDNVSKATKELIIQLEKWLNSEDEETGSRVMALVIPKGTDITIQAVGESGLEDLPEVKVTYERIPKAPW